MRFKITGFKTFGVKKFLKVADTKELTLYNVFGFGLWFIKNGYEWKKEGEGS